MRGLRIGIIQGGPGFYYDASLRTARNMWNHLSNTYEPRNIFIDQEGAWYIDGRKISPESIGSRVDVVINALHGPYGSDGRFQQFLGSSLVPHTGSSILGSALSTHKLRAHDYLRTYGVRAPHGVLLWRDEPRERHVRKIFESVSSPWVLKPVNESFSRGVIFVKKKEDLPPVLEEIFQVHDSIIVEEFMRGIEIACGVIDTFRHENIYALPPVEIEKSSMPIFSTHYKEHYRMAHRIPGRLSEEQKRMVQEVAQRAHQALGLRHYSESNMIIHPNGTVFLLEVNTLPDLSRNSLFERSLKAIGSSMRDFLRHLINLAIRRR